MITRNGSAFLAEQLESLAAQTRRPDELVVSDDGSTDSTIDLCRAFAADAPFPVRVLVNSAPLGPSQNRAQSMAACTSSMVALADQDDVWHPEKLARMASALASNDLATLAFCDGEVVDEFRRHLGVGLWDSLGFDLHRRRRVAGGHAFQELIGRNFVSGPALLFRPSLLEAALPIPQGMRADAWLGLIAAATAAIVPVSERLIEYRQSAVQQIGAGTDLATRLRLGVIRRLPLQLREWAERESPMAGRLDRLETLHGRLVELEGSPHPPHPGFTRAVADRIAHWQVRSALPHRRGDRIDVVRAEYATGRYGRYSLGARSAAADLVYPVRRAAIRPVPAPGPDRQAAAEPPGSRRQ